MLRPFAAFVVGLMPAGGTGYDADDHPDGAPLSTPGSGTEV